MVGGWWSAVGGLIYYFLKSSRDAKILGRGRSLRYDLRLEI